MPHALTPLQREYLEFIRQYVATNEGSPRLEEISEHFNVKAPTAHKTLKALQSKGYLYFGRDSVSGFFIRLIERAGSAEMMMEVPIAGRMDKYGELHEFPANHGHFASVFVGVDPQKIFAIAAGEDIPQASILSQDLIIFDYEKVPQPGDICIIPFGKRTVLVQVYSTTFDGDTPSLTMANQYPIPEKLKNPEFAQKLNWAPMAYDSENEEFFLDIAKNEGGPLGPIPPEFVLATALRLSRQLAF